MLKLATELSIWIRDPFSTSAPLNHRWTIPWKHVLPPQGTSSFRVPRPPPSQPTNCSPLKTLCIPFRMLRNPNVRKKKARFRASKRFNSPSNGVAARYFVFTLYILQVCIKYFVFIKNIALQLQWHTVDRKDPCLLTAESCKYTYKCNAKPNGLAV
jgi:hypothetical protein